MFERADCCIARSQRTYVKGMNFLKFCQHHADQHQPVLLALGWELIVPEKMPEESVDTNALVTV